LGCRQAATGFASATAQRRVATLTGHQFSPPVIAGPFRDGSVVVGWLAVGMSLVGALASAIRPPREARAQAKVSR
jgi:hypothetical protein